MKKRIKYTNEPVNFEDNEIIKISPLKRYQISLLMPFLSVLLGMFVAWSVSEEMTTHIGAFELILKWFVGFLIINILIWFLWIWVSRDSREKSNDWTFLSHLRLLKNPFWHFGCLIAWGILSVMWDPNYLTIGTAVGCSFWLGYRMVISMLEGKM